MAPLVLTQIPSCTKTDTAIRKFSKHDTWTVTEIDDGLGSIYMLPKWKVNKCKPESNDFCEGTWQHAGGSAAGFKWRFGYSGTYFEFYPTENQPEEQNQAWIQCYNLSGKYDVLRQRSGLLEIESDQTTGYPGKLIFISLN